MILCDVGGMYIVDKILIIPIKNDKPLKILSEYFNDELDSQEELIKLVDSVKAL
jgi:hypothetical protein